ncbi:unnamed protein product [Toxocara canis]|uniref:Protein kinase domain-containing protein n=1 Tax=Toxocara canis TaxID=6265 RepID=A0A183U5Q3_TOXCA|nr:unnamed protein product [Toxocara canis]
MERSNVSAAGYLLGELIDPARVGGDKCFELGELKMQRKCEEHKTSLHFGTVSTKDYTAAQYESPESFLKVVD